MMIAQRGEPKAKAVVQGWVKNLAAPVFLADTTMLKAVIAGAM